MAKRSIGGKGQNATGTKAADTAAAEGLSMTADYRHSDAKRPNLPALREGMFVAKVISDSMEPLVPKDSWCLFKPYDGGSREGRNLLVTHQSIREHGFPIRVTLKRYHSEKIVDPSTSEWRHTKIVLKPLNPARDEIEISESEGDDGARTVRVVAELVGPLAGTPA